MPFFVMKSALFVQANVAVNMGVSAGGGEAWGRGTCPPKFLRSGRRNPFVTRGKHKNF